MQKKMFVTQLLKPTIKLKRQRLTNRTGSQHAPPTGEQLYTADGCFGWMDAYKPESCCI